MKVNRIISIILAGTLLAISSAGCGAKDTAKDTIKTAAAPTEDQKLAEIKAKLDREFTDFYGEGVFSGYVYISKGGTVLLDKGFGKADFGKGIENTKQTKFDIGSITKQITAFAIMQLEEKKLLSVNDTIDKHLPSFPHGKEITIHQLLTHTSGLPEYSTDFDIKKFRPSYKGFGKEGKDENVKLLFTPGSVFQYSNPGYILLGYIVEKLSGKTLGEYFEENIFKPLDMNNTAFRDANGSAKDLATGYANEKKEKAEQSWTLTNVGYVYGSGGLCSTAEDLVKWDKALIEQKLLRKESYEKIYTPNKSNYGYGVYINKDSKGNRSYEHFGLSAGYRTYVLRGVDENTIAIVVSNFQNLPLEIMATQLKNYIK